MSSRGRNGYNNAYNNRSSKNGQRTDRSLKFPSKSVVPFKENDPR
jgi:hypothetical protein